MAKENKTKQTDVSPQAFIAAVDNPKRRADAERDQREPQRLGPRRDRDGVFATRRVRELDFERLGLGTEEVTARSEHARDHLTELGLEMCGAPGEIDDRQAPGRATRHRYQSRWRR